MNIPEHFEFHYVENGVKKSVTLFTAMLFRKPPSRGALPRARKTASINEQRSG